MASTSNSALREALALNIQAIVPHLPEQKVHGLIDFLISKGVKKETDLRRITVLALEAHLNDFVDASDLFDEWQTCYGSRNVALQPSKVSNTQASSSSSSATPARNPQPNANAPPLNATVPQLNANPRSVSAAAVACGPRQLYQMPKFDRDSPFLPGAVKEAIDNKERPSASARASMVERIVDHCRETVPNLQRAMFNPVAIELVKLYPESFRDTLLVSEHGSDSLAKQMRDKFDNDKRPAVPTRKEKEAPACKQAYGCLRWNPPLPEDSSVDAQEDIRVGMVKMFQTSRKEWEWRLIKKNMQESFYLQRKQINGALAEAAKATSKKRKRGGEDGSAEEQVQKVSVSDLKQQWPFLFTARGMNYHFLDLVGVDFRTNLFDFVQEDSVVYIEFLASKKEELASAKLEMVRAERNGFSNAKLPTLLKMLVIALKDDFTYLVRFVESTTLFEEVEASVNLPETPIIIAAGSNLYDTKKFYLCIDGVAITTEVTLMECFSSFFVSYFVLNIEYPPALSGLLNFTQRIIAKIAPQKGSKTKTAAVDRLAKERVVKLHNKFSEYKQRVDKEN